VQNVGRNSGTIHFTWDAFANGDQFAISYEGVQIFTTPGFVANQGAADVSFGPGASTFVSVTVTTGPMSNVWTYTLSCAVP
jgi:hypothetical protein